MKVMFICTGNICRSAMGQALLEKRVKELNKNIEVYSSGIYAYTGDKATNHAISIMKNYNVDLENHRATYIKETDIIEMDLILCATKNHKDIILEEYPKLQNKVYTIKEYAEYDLKGGDIDINDPYGGNLESYKKCATEISDCIELILKKI